MDIVTGPDRRAERVRKKQETARGENLSVEAWWTAHPLFGTFLPYSGGGDPERTMQLATMSGGDTDGFTLTGVGGEDFARYVAALQQRGEQLGADSADAAQVQRDLADGIATFYQRDRFMTVQLEQQSGQLYFTVDRITGD